METDYYLLAVIPNQQARLALQKTRRALYRTFGLISALALEPVIPITILNHKLQKDKVMSLLTPTETENVKTPSFSLTGVSLVDNFIFLDIAETDIVRPLRRQLQEFEMAGEVPVPLHTGLFFAHCEGEKSSEIIGFLQNSSVLTQDWDSSRIGLYELSLNRKDPELWDGASWGLIWQFPFRKTLA